MMSSHTRVVLPSIHEMFPEYLMKPSTDARNHTKSMVAPISPQSSPRLHPYASRRHSTAPAPAQQHRPTAIHAPHSYHDSPPSSYPRSTPSDSPDFSFDVLRSDPSSSSLQHIASSLTFHSHTRGVPSSSSSPGYAPAFRVSVPESTPLPLRPSSSPSPRSAGVSRPHRPSTATISTAASGGMTHKHDSITSHPPAPAYSTLSFPVSGPQTHFTPGLVGPGGVLAEDLRYGSPTTTLDDADLNASDGELSSNGKKHICPTCHKRFNRPSSLRIHVNTHTGATPFRCPWPNCGREFNVNSNMRRHYRNHTTPGFSRPQPSSSSSSSSSAEHHQRRRKRRIAPHGLVFVTGNSSVTASSPHSTTSPLGQAGYQHPHAHRQTVMKNGSVSSSDDSDEDMSEPAELGDEDELLPHDSEPLLDMDSAEYIRSKSPYERQHLSFQRYSQSHLRSAAMPEVVVYSPSREYARVSTTLRPAFGRGGVKEEPLV